MPKALGPAEQHAEYPETAVRITVEDVQDIKVTRKSSSGNGELSKMSRSSKAETGDQSASKKVEGGRIEKIKARQRARIELQLEEVRLKRQLLELDEEGA